MEYKATVINNLWLDALFRHAWYADTTKNAHHASQERDEIRAIIDNGNMKSWT